MTSPEFVMASRSKAKDLVPVPAKSLPLEGKVAVRLNELTDEV